MCDRRQITNHVWPGLQMIIEWKPGKFYTKRKRPGRLLINVIARIWVEHFTSVSHSDHLCKRRMPTTSWEFSGKGICKKMSDGRMANQLVDSGCLESPVEKGFEVFTSQAGCGLGREHWSRSDVCDVPEGGVEAVCRISGALLGYNMMKPW